jgi:hypothetical protein
MTDIQDSTDFPADKDITLDPVFSQQVQKLYQLSVRTQWLFVGLFWLTVAPISLWTLRSEFALWADYLTWTAVRYTIAYNRPQAIALSFCIGMTIAVLVRQSRTILYGLPAEEQQRLKDQVLRIRRQGQSHPLWKRICQ